MKKEYRKEFTHLEGELYKFIEAANDNVYHEDQYSLVYNLCEFIKVVGRRFDDDTAERVVKASEEYKKFLLEDYGDEE